LILAPSADIVRLSPNTHVEEQGEAMTPTATDAAVETETDETAEAVVVEDVLVEDVSIDGMCGVY